jgi:hypothetical protein
MNNVFFVLGFLSTLAAPLNNYSKPVQPVIQVEDKPKKEILININSTFYKDPSQVVEGVFKQARIYDFTIDEKVKEIKNKNIQFKNKTVQQALDILSKLYNVSFKVEEIGKEKFYSVETR